MTIGLWSPFEKKSGMRGLLHAGRELDVEVLDGEFAGDEAGEKRIASSYQQFILSLKIERLME